MKPDEACDNDNVSRESLEKLNSWHVSPWHFTYLDIPPFFPSLWLFAVTWTRTCTRGSGNFGKKLKSKFCECLSFRCVFLQNDTALQGPQLSSGAVPCIGTCAMWPAPALNDSGSGHKCIASPRVQSDFGPGHLWPAWCWWLVPVILMSYWCHTVSNTNLKWKKIELSGTVTIQTTALQRSTTRA